jgi:RNA polymerase sigma factor (sigma-70 family)
VFDHLSNDVILRTVAMAQAGDNEVFDELAELARPVIYAYILNKVYDEDATADLTQDTLVHAWTRLGQFDSTTPGSSFAAWLYSIAFHLTIDLVRQRKRRQTISISVLQAITNRGNRLKRAASSDDFDINFINETIINLADDDTLPETALLQTLHRELAPASVAHLAARLSLTDRLTLASLWRWHDLPVRNGDGPGYRVAAELGLTRQATKSAIHRARKRARAALAEIGVMSA